jgi:hypothetical protein
MGTNKAFQLKCLVVPGAEWIPTLCGTALAEDTLYYTLVIFYIIITLVTWYLVFDVAKVCIGNYFAGKTTIERFGRSGGFGGDLEDVWERIVNSGIKGDKRIYESLETKDFDKL